MDITINLEPFLQLFNLSMGQVFYRVFFWYFGWLPVACVFMWGLLEIWLQNRRIAWEHTQKFILLAIDVPRNNEQSTRAVENLFTYFAGAHQTLSLIEKWWEGKFQLAFSFEIVSIGGYIQYIIYTPAQFRQLVETAIYSQYPDAEVYEVEDYTKMAPHKFPNDEYDLWGSEFVQVAHELLPIRTYIEFEHESGDPKTTFRDPMMSLMDLMSSLKKGEQIWYQIMVIPTDTAWAFEVDHYIDSILGRHKGKPSIVDKIMKWISDASEMIYQLWGDIHDSEHKEDQLTMMNLTPVQKKRVEAAHQKTSKLGFEVCIRMIYLSRIEVMNKPKAANGFVGYIKQFNTNDLNALKPDTKMTMTSAQYFFTKRRLIHKKNSIMHGYRHRSEMVGRKPWIMNVEELATLWHFPLQAITKAPLIQQAAGKRIEPPMSLPTDTEGKTLSKVDPIFDDDYEINDEPAAADTHHEEPAAKPRNSRPGFLEDEIEEQAPEANEPEPPIVEPVSEPVKASAPRGAAPDNLPFE